MASSPVKIAGFLWDLSHKNEDILGIYGISWIFFNMGSR
jgi:hypothetical protein